MKTVATLNEVPANALRADAQPDGTWLVYEPGDTLPLVAATPEVPTKFVTPAQYRNKFTDAELSAILASTDPSVKLLVLKVSTAPAEGIDLLNPTVTTGLQYLVAKGILTAERPAQIIG